MTSLRVSEALLARQEFRVDAAAILRHDGQGITMAEHQAVDQAALDKLQKMGGTGFVRQMISLFVDFGGKKVQEARAALEERNIHGVEKCVHAIKSSAMNLGANQVFEIASQMERFTRENELENLPQLQSKLEREFEQAKVSLERIAGELVE